MVFEVKQRDKQREITTWPRQKRIKLFLLLSLCTVSSPKVYLHQDFHYQVFPKETICFFWQVIYFVHVRGNFKVSALMPWKNPSNSAKTSQKINTGFISSLRAISRQLKSPWTSVQTIQSHKWTPRDPSLVWKLHPNPKTPRQEPVKELDESSTIVCIYLLLRAVMKE